MWIMSLNAETLNQAREALADLGQHNKTLLAEVQEQARKIGDLEREVQKQASIAAQARQALMQTRIENDALRCQLPTDATERAFNDLECFLAAPADCHEDLQ